MSFPHTPQFPIRPRPAARPQALRRELVRKVPWGWLEVVILAGTLLPALLFIPGVSKVRTVTRVASYVIMPVAWWFVARRQRPSIGVDTFPARPWLVFSAVWLALSVFHPNAHTLLAASAQAALYITIFCPAFWAGMALDSRRQIGRLLALLFLCNALSSAVGVAQVFRPGTFMPPDMPALRNEFGGQNLMYETADGRKIFRPTGLTDTPGGAGLAGVTAALIGFCWALRPIAAWKRLASVGLAFLGIAVIYFTHVRVALVMLLLSFVTLIGLFVLQRNTRQAVLLAVGGVGSLVGALLWAIRSVGSSVTERFVTLFQNDPVTVFGQNRGGFVRDAFEHLIWEIPLGGGMGWWGMTRMYFGNMNVRSPVWVELMWQAWLQDGGLPLLIGYSGALVVALFDSARIALTCPDRDVAYWGAVIVSLNLSVVAACFCGVAFLSPLGVQFWILAAALHAADCRARAASRGALAAVSRPPVIAGAS
ncbi:MAG: hypothetical protein P4L84_34550 [Isosphaeraceae bacterium]|nr:hypothetical protein [Isosphaeraceae bacterium]